MDQKKEGIRLNKYISSSGLCTRREAGDLVIKGKVKVNDQVVTNPAYMVQPMDQVTYDKKRIIPKRNYTYILLNKPKKTLSQVTTVEGKRTVIQCLGNKVNAPVKPLDSLSYMSLGLMILTDDEELIEKFKRTDKKLKQLYHISLEDSITMDQFEAFKEMVSRNDNIQVDAINLLEKKDNKELRIQLSKGMDTDLLDAIAQSNISNFRLDRLTLGTLTKKDLPRGWNRPLTEKEVIMFKHFL